jgi:protein-ribulosamine 3-kinase
MARGVITREFIDNYTNTTPKSQPEQDFDARNLLYLLAFEARVSATITGDPMFREIVTDCLSKLEEIVPETYEEWALARGEEICPPKSPGFT